MRGMTKPLCLAIEAMVTTELEKVLGKGENFLSDGEALQWKMPYGQTGTVSLILFKDSHVVGNAYRDTWLACKLRDPNFVGTDGYTKPQNQIESGWPWMFTYPSGKCNLYFEKDMVKNRHALATHLYSISAPNSREKFEFGKIEFETVD